MKINEVEALVGITKKNIRFYEEQGLLKPGRNSQNGYREYGEPEVELLRQIKLLRKLGVPLEEIRQMQTGSRTLGDGMRRHLVTLERERKNLDQAVQFCQALRTGRSGWTVWTRGDCSGRWNRWSRRGLPFWTASRETPAGSGMWPRWW